MSTALDLGTAMVRERGPGQTVPRAKLIDATIESIHRHGLSRTTLASVAEIAGTSASIINFHFKSKDALLLSTLESVADSFASVWRAALHSAPDDAARRLCALVDASFAPANRDVRKLSVWNAFWGDAAARSDYLTVCTAIEDALYEELVRLCRRIAHEGGYRNIDEVAVATALYYLLDGLPESALSDPEGFDWMEARRTCYAFLASVFTKHIDMPASPSCETRRTQRPQTRDTAPAPPGRRETLPSWVYHNDEFLELEKEHIFRRNWILVGHTSELPGPGDYITTDMVDERILVIRDLDGQLRGFHNVCRHRAARVVVGQSGTCKRVITCPYHGWTYGFDGTLKGVPAQQTFGDLDRSQFSLPAVDVEEWMGFIFIRLGGNGLSVAELLGPYEDELAHYCFAEMQPHGLRWSFTMDVNWKTVLDNDNEGYHVPVGHPGLQRMFGNSYHDEVLENGVSRSYSRLRDKLSPVWSEGLYQRLLPEVARLPEELRRAWLYYGLFPNLSMAIYPDMMSYFQVFPLSTTKCMLRGHAYALPDDRREMRAARWLNERINRQVWLEDRNLVFWADSGLRSSSYQAGVLSDKESAVGQFHNLIRAALPVARTKIPPAPGRVVEVNSERRMAAE
jgi:phenylpropionate dioxygenase-like ring-hydroxylating dioxygenase large terminal subunit/AcrR family transcriptional regulator